MRKFVGVNDHGIRVGQSHQGAKLTDHEVELLLRFHEHEGWGYKRLAAKFDMSPSGVRSICKGRNRGQLAVRFVLIETPDPV